MTSPIRLIATDLDGTLLREDNTISRRTACTLRAAADAGLWLVAATGRQLRNLPESIDACGFGHAVGANGAVGIDFATGEMLFEELVSAEVAKSIEAYLRPRLPEIRFSASRDHGARHIGEPGYAEMIGTQERLPANWRFDTEPIEVVLSAPTLKLIVRHPIVTPAQLLQLLDESGLTGFSATMSGCPFVEIGGAFVTKASGLSRLCELLGIDPTEVLAAGDSHNDLEMIRWAGRGVAMANAVPEVLAVADVVTSSNQQDGLALAVEAVLKERRARNRSGTPS